MSRDRMFRVARAMASDSGHGSDTEATFSDSAANSSTSRATRAYSFRRACNAMSRILTSSNGNGAEASNSDPGGGGGSGSVSVASPGKQRRGFSGRWLGLRGKPNQAKNEKTTSSGSQSPANTDKPVPFKKIPSDRKLKLPYPTTTDNNGESSHNAVDETEVDEAELELPPPMKPIQDPQTVLQAPAVSTQTPQAERNLQMDMEANGASADIADLEQIVKTSIEQHGATPATSKAEEDGEQAAGAALDEPNEATLKKREYVLKELVETEEIYVADLRLVVEGYMAHIHDHPNDPPLPEGLRDRRNRMIFCNIEIIYEWHRDKFLEDLRKCVDRPELLGPLFRRFLEKRIFMYEHYCRNKPVSEYIVSDHDQYFQEVRNKLGQKLQLADLLIKPIQRIQKYHLLMKKILCYTEQANCPAHVIASLTDAMKCSAIIPKNANNMMDVGRLQGFTGNIQAQGKLLRQETMFVADISNNANERGREKETHVFLFEQCVIFSDPVGRRSQFVSPTYHYRAHIQMNKMELEENKGDAFVIHSLDPSKPRVSFACRSEGHRQEWLDALKNIIESQLNFGVALENPGAYLRELRDPL